MTFENDLGFFYCYFYLSITPGPGVFAILSRALVFGASACFFLVLGMVTSDIIYLILACYGLATLAEHWSETFMVVRIISAICLIYLGAKIWRTSRQQLPTEIGLKQKLGCAFCRDFKNHFISLVYVVKTIRNSFADNSLAPSQARCQYVPSGLA